MVVVNGLLRVFLKDFTDCFVAVYQQDESAADVWRARPPGSLSNRQDLPPQHTKPLKTPLKCVFITNLTENLLTVFRGFRRQDHRRPGGPSLLHQVSGVPSVFSRTLLWGDISAPSVGGFCCPLLVTVSTAPDSATLVKEENKKPEKVTENLENVARACVRNAALSRSSWFWSSGAV